MATVKTGEVRERREDGSIWLIESFEDEDTHVVYSTETMVEPPEAPQ